MTPHHGELVFKPRSSLYPVRITRLDEPGMNVVATDMSTEDDKARIPFLDINQEREFGYEGYTGMLELARQLALTIQSPVWESVRKPAPWRS